MFSWLGKFAAACWRPLSRYARMNKDEENDMEEEIDHDGLIWSKELERHAFGEFSFAVAQSNQVIEDHSQVETGHCATFVGVYDGHGGPEASRFVSDNLFQHMIRLAKESGTISEGILKSAFSATEDGFLGQVRRIREFKPLIAASGSCCLVGVIWKGTLYVANLGDSRAVIGCLGRKDKIVGEQLTQDHNASMEEVRQELRSLHPDDPTIVILTNGAWRVKGIIQVSRSIGDAYLKRQEFAIDSSFPKFHLPEPLRRPVLRADPSLYTRVLRPDDRFIIFASDGLWEHISNQRAVEIVYNNPRVGIARKLVKEALTVAAKKRGISYMELKMLEKAMKRYVHDDITAIVIFIDHEALEGNVIVPEISVHGLQDTVGPSSFSKLQGTTST